MIKLDHFAVLIAVVVIVVLSLWPLQGHGEGDQEGHDDATEQGKEHGNTGGDAAGDAGGHAVHWSYGGAEGPEHWGDLSAEFAVCKSGRMQSPIDIAADATGLAVGAPGHDFAYTEAPLSILHNGHTVQLNYAPGSSMSVQGQQYELLQFHFHAPSEHTVGGRSYPMEAHFVHKDSHGGLAVVGVLIEEGAANAALADAWAHLPGHEAAEQTMADVRIDADAILPADRRYHHYKGSLTTPPCSEGVRWFVLTQPISMSAAQIEKFEAAAAPNARPIQALNGRLLIGPN
jgi:carbonic anhydrase